MKLTAKQRKFADEYIKSGNATQAAIRAGYSRRTAAVIGNENLIKPYIKSYIDERMKHIESHNIAKAAEVLQYFTTVLRGEAKENIVVSTPDGAEMVENDPSIKDRMSAGKELLKRYPADDRMLGAQIKKLEAEAEMAELRVKQADGSSDSQVIVNIKVPKGGDDDS